MLDWESVMDVLEAKPEYENAVRCLIDMELSSPIDDSYVIVPGEFVASGKENLTFDTWFNPSIIGVTYGTAIPDEWLLVGVLHRSVASDEELSKAMQFVADRNAKILEDK